MIRRRVIAVTSVLALGATLVPGTSTARVPDGYRVRRERIARGLTHLSLRSGSRSIHVARIAPGSPLKVQPVPSRGNRTGTGPKLEPTSRLCRRVRCLMAVNGDFFRDGEPVGGLILDGKPLKPPKVGWRQAVFDDERNLSAGRVKLRAVLVTSDLQRRRIIRVDKRRAGGLVLFTPSFGRSTPSGDAVEAVFRVRDPKGPLRVGQTSVVRLTEVRARGRTRIPRDGIVISGRGAAGRWLRAMDDRVRRREITRDVLVRLRANTDVWDSLGGRPVIVRAGRPVVGPSRDGFVTGAHPRTLLGRTADGAILLVTVDGRQRRRRGMSLGQAARLMIRLGAVEAINLDGGGSTTFVRRGRVINHPSDGHERPVAVALAVVAPTVGVDRPRAPHLSALSSERPSPAVPDAAAPGADAADPAIVTVAPVAAVPISARGPRALALTALLVTSAAWVQRRRVSWRRGRA